MEIRFKLPEYIKSINDKIDYGKLEDSKYKNIAESITILDIVNAMFSYNVFRFKTEDPVIFMLLKPEVAEMVNEFIEHGYRRCEDKRITWTGGMRWQKCKRFALSDYFQTAMRLYDDTKITLKTEPTMTIIRDPQSPNNDMW